MPASAADPLGRPRPSLTRAGPPRAQVFTTRCDATVKAAATDGATVFAGGRGGALCQYGFAAELLAAPEAAAARRVMEGEADVNALAVDRGADGLWALFVGGGDGTVAKFE